jgi:hypothetical protein
MTNPIINKLRKVRENTLRNETQVIIKPLSKIGGVVYASECAGQFYARGYLRKATKPRFNYVFRTEEARETYVKQWVQDLVEREESKKKDRAERKSGHDLKVGDILNTSWGYDQTNVDYFQVVGLKSKTMVYIREVQQMQHDESHVLPIKDAFIGEKIAKRVNAKYNVIKISECQRAYPTTKNEDGSYKPSYKTPWGMGH